MKMILMLQYHWNVFRMNYHRALYDSCLDQTIKAELKKKLDARQQTLDKFQAKQNLFE